MPQKKRKALRHDILDKRWYLLFNRLPSLSLFSLSICCQEGGAMEKPRFEKGKMWEKKKNLKAIHSFRAFIFCTSLMQDATTASSERFSGKKGRAAGRGGHLTVKKGELCSRISTVLNTRLRDCSVHAEGGERREGRNIGKKEGGRGGNSAQCKLAGSVAAAAQAAASAPLAVASFFVAAGGCVVAAAGIKIIHIHTQISGHRHSHFLTYTHICFGGQQRKGSEWRGSGDRGTQEKETGTAAGSANERRAGGTATGAEAAVAAEPWHKPPNSSARPRTSLRPPPRSKGRRRRRR